MTNFKLPEPIDFQHIETKSSVLFPDDIDIYTHNQLVKALTDLGDEIAGRFSSPYSNYELVIKHIVKELLK